MVVNTLKHGYKTDTIAHTVADTAKLWRRDGDDQPINIRFYQFSMVTQGLSDRKTDHGVKRLSCASEVSQHHCLLYVTVWHTGRAMPFGGLEGVALKRRHTVCVAWCMYTTIKWRWHNKASACENEMPCHACGKPWVGIKSIAKIMVFAHPWNLSMIHKNNGMHWHLRWSMWVWVG